MTPFGRGNLLGAQPVGPLQWYKGKSVKKGFFSGFREYFLIGVSYVPDFFIAVKNYVGRTF